MRQERRVNLHLSAANQLLPVYCHPGFSSYGDSASLTFATSGTGAHPGSRAVIVPAPRHPRPSAPSSDAEEIQKSADL